MGDLYSSADEPIDCITMTVKLYCTLFYCNTICTVLLNILQFNNDNNFIIMFYNSNICTIMLIGANIHSPAF